ncbi:unnamed protein product [Tuber melanosporum]|uniref:(Perigord truffle) hypothetical protein n=1 Tax=Tuber melanosporum (strain Mel28) TaxID=656061 RepID=D5GIF3_TUBMM|nr:uncharacterized protein GSTUM_00008469001 [Tuber melanosporum]CAZ84296.1 unnamed protein product [Tuber melanosporum]
MWIRCLASSPIVVRKLVASPPGVFGDDEGNGAGKRPDAICRQWVYGSSRGQVGDFHGEDLGSHTLLSG